MTRKSVLLWILQLLFLPPMICMAQDMSGSGTGTWNMAIVSNFPDCTTRNCFHAMPGFASSIYAANGSVFVIDANHTGYSYTEYPTNSWTAHPEWGQVYGIEAGGDGNIYALYGPGGGGCVNEGFHSLGRWNGSGWTQLTYCFASFSIAQDGLGMILLIDGNGVLWGATSFGASGYAHYPMPGSGTAISVAAVNSNPGNWVVIMNDNTIWSYNGTSYTQLTSTGRGSRVAADGHGAVYVLGVGSDHTVYHWNGTTWDHMTGSGITSIVDGDDTNVWTIGATSGGNNVYRFSENGVQFSRNWQGSVVCTVPPPGQGICNTFTHTAKSQISVQGHTGTLQTQNWNGPGQWGVTSTVNANDLFDCVENGCSPTASTENMTCSGGGSVGASGGNVREVHNYVKRAPGAPVYDGPAWTGALWVGTVKWPVSSACVVGVPTCPIATITALEKDPTQAGAQADMIAAPYAGPWMMLSLYDPAKGPPSDVSCRQLVLLKHAIPDLCD